MSTTTVTVNTVSFAKAFAKATKGTLPKSSVEALKRVFLSVEDNSLIIRSSAIETWFSREIEASAITGDAQVTNASLKPDSLTKALKFFPKADTTLVFDTDDKSVEVICGSKRIKLSCLFDDDFPTLPKLTGRDNYVLDIKDIAKRMAKVKYAVAETDVKPLLTGIHFNGAEMVACDGYRLALSKGTQEVRKPFTIPVKALAYACECMEDVADAHRIVVRQDDKYICFMSFADFSMVYVRLIEGSYIDYQRVIPQNADNHRTIGREKMLDVLKYLKLFITDVVAEPVIYKGDTLTARTKDGTFEESIGIDSPLNDKIGFNIKYMQDAFGQFSKGTNVDFAIGQRNIEPIVLTEGDDLALVLPMRLKD